MISRRRLVGALAGTAVTTMFAAVAQPKNRVWKVGVISVWPAHTSPEAEGPFEVFVRALNEAGFTEGKNIAFERRASEGHDDRASALAAELVSAQVDVIVAIFSTTGYAALAAAATKIPIVALGVSDPVGLGLAASLGRPGGNITGLTDFKSDLIPKMLELLKAAAPKSVRVAFVYQDHGGNVDTAMVRSQNERNDRAAQALGISLVRIPLNAPQDFERATAMIVREHADALLFESTSTNVFLRHEIAEFAIRNRLPSMVASRITLSGGALMSYGADYSDIYRKAAGYVAKILNGAKPADLPMERPTKVELVINLKTAKAIGLTIPESLLLRADEVIQ
jgi:putative tryptophan/tyrosine transport system substrate-binding protein